MLKLVENKVLDVAIDENTQRPFPVEVGFKIDNMEGWTGKFYCEFGQVNTNGELCGIARVISDNGTILEGNFANNKEDGWVRMIFHNKADYAISWFKDGKFNGYCYRKDVEECSTNLEAQF